MTKITLNGNYSLKKENSWVDTRDARDFMRTGDQKILKRVLIKNFIHSQISQKFEKDKTNALILLLFNDPQTQIKIDIPRPLPL